jgi:hypothetical protein
MVGDVANHIAAEVGGTQYPAGLGHIQIPYSQADGLFLNTILAHEMGHFIYQEYASHDVEVAIDTALGAMEKETGELNEGTAALCEELVSNWVQEVFCDLFAICLIGCQGRSKTRPAWRSKSRPVDDCVVVVGLRGRRASGA